MIRPGSTPPMPSLSGRVLHRSKGALPPHPGILEHGSGVRSDRQDKRPRVVHGTRAPRRTVGPVTSCPVASRRARLRFTGPIHEIKFGGILAPKLDTFRGIYQKYLTVERRGCTPPHHRRDFSIEIVSGWFDRTE